MFAVIPQAYRNGDGDTLPISKRTVFYQARPLLEAADVEVTYGYFCDLLAEYELAHPESW